MVYMYHSFLIHSSADGYLGCLHVLAVINSVQPIFKSTYAVLKSTYPMPCELFLFYR